MEPLEVEIQRPPPGLRRGRRSAPTWLIATLGGLALLFVIGFYLRRLRARGKR